MPNVYRGFTMNAIAEPSNWSSRESDLLKAIIDKLPEKPDTLVTNEHTHHKLVASDGAPDPAVQCDADGNLIVGNGLAVGDSLLHVFEASAGVVAAAAGTIATFEKDDTLILSILTPDDKTASFYFGNPTKNPDGYLTYNPSTHRMYFGCDGINILDLRKDDGYIRVTGGYALRSSSAAGLQLQNDSGDGCTVNDDGDLQMDADEYLRLGHAAVSETSVAAVEVYGPAPLNQYVPVKQTDGSIFWCLGTTSEPA